MVSRLYICHDKPCQNTANNRPIPATHHGFRLLVDAEGAEGFRVELLGHAVVDHGGKGGDRLLSQAGHEITPRHLDATDLGKADLGVEWSEREVRRWMRGVWVIRKGSG